jgi:4-carboxymuconolactone decarboxylase
MLDEQREQLGSKIRQEVLGSEHVKNSRKQRNSFNAPFQDFITRYAWGEIWSRPDLSRHNRSLITLALMVALNREEEFKMHVKAALNNGVSVEEIREVLLHTSVYCGLPATNSAFRWAESVLSVETPKKSRSKRSS